MEHYGAHEFYTHGDTLWSWSQHECKQNDAKILNVNSYQIKGDWENTIDDSHSGNMFLSLLGTCCHVHIEMRVCIYIYIHNIYIYIDR